MYQFEGITPNTPWIVACGDRLLQVLLSMQKKAQHGGLDELTSTLDYTFIDLPELVDGTLMLCVHKPCQQRWLVKQPRSSRDRPRDDIHAHTMLRVLCSLGGGRDVSGS